MRAVRERPCVHGPLDVEKYESRIEKPYGRRLKGRGGGRIVTPILPSLITLLLLSSLVWCIPVKGQGIHDDDLQGATDIDPPTNDISSKIPSYQEAMRFFIENQGQFPADVKFMAVTDFGKALFLDSQVQYWLDRYQDGNVTGFDVIALTFPHADEVAPQGEGLCSHYTNYFIGDPEHWVTGARNYGSIIYPDLWPGIDLTYRFSEDGLKYEFTVDPSMSVEVIKIAVEGASVQGGPSSISLDTGHGWLVDGDLLAIQEGGSSGLSVSFRTENNVIGFDVEGRDPTKTLIIDPLIYSTLIGGSDYDFSDNIAVDGQGNVYITGRTDSSDFPDFSPLQASLSGTSDVFVLKLNADGQTLVYSTYLGGSGDDYGSRVAIDGNGNAYVVGSTTSSDFPMHSPIQSAYGGGSYDAFALKLNAAGNALLYSTYLGGSAEDVGNGIDVDVDGSAYIVGYTLSVNFIVVSPLQNSNAGSYDAFALKINAAGNALGYSTYLGGSDTDSAWNVVVDDSGNACVTGTTYSTDFPILNPYQGTIAGSSDAFVLKINVAGNALIFSTYLGGADQDFGQDLALDEGGNVYNIGTTYSLDLPTVSAFQTTNAGNGDAFVFKLNPTGSNLIYSTFIGGGDNDIPMGIAIDASGNAYVAGYTNSTDFPIIRPLQASNAGSYDAFVLKLNPAGNDLILSTYFGGDDTDAAYGIAISAGGNIYVTGGSYSADYPVFNAFQASNSGNCDAFVFKFNIEGSGLLYSTYFGGSAEDEGYAITLDPAGNIYVTGFTLSSNLPTVNPYQGTYQGSADVFILKFGPGGNNLLYSTFVGGEDEDEGIDIAVDSNGNAYVTGYSYSTDFPTSNAIQAGMGGYVDAFVLKLNAAGNGLSFSTYIGGDDTDYGQGIAIDASGNAYVTGGTYSTDFPTSNPLQAGIAGDRDAFVLKLNSAGSALSYSTYLGGSAGDQGLDIAIDAMGNAFVTGSTESTDFPIVGAVQGVIGGKVDAFVVKVNDAGSAISYSTYVGGAEDEYGHGIVVNAQGGAYLVGNTNSTDFPVQSAFQDVNRGLYDVFVLKLNTAGSTLLYSTYLGGSDDDYGHGITIDASGNFYVTGSTYSPDFPVACPLDADLSGIGDAFVLGFNRIGSVLLYSTYLGGSDEDYAWSIAVDGDGNAYVSGGSYSSNFPVANPFQTVNAGLSDAFIVRLGLFTTPSVPLGLTATPGDGYVVLNWNAPTSNGGYPIDYYVVYRNGEDVAHPITNSVNITGLTNGVAYSFAVAAHSEAGLGPVTSTISATPEEGDGGGGGSGDSSLFLIIGIAAAAAVGVLVVIFVLRGRKSRVPVQPKVKEQTAPTVAQPPVVPRTEETPRPPPPPTVEAKFCPWCGAQTDGEFCGNCGRKVD